MKNFLLITFTMLLFIGCVSSDGLPRSRVIIDMQNATGNRHMGLGKLLAEQGNSDSAQYRFNRIDDLLIPNIQKLIAGFRAAGASIIWITYGANARDASDAPPHIAPLLKEHKSCGL